MQNIGVEFIIAEIDFLNRYGDDNVCPWVPNRVCKYRCEGYHIKTGSIYSVVN